MGTNSTTASQLAGYSPLAINQIFLTQPRRVLKHLEHIFTFKVRGICQYILDGAYSANLTNDHSHGHAHTSTTGSTALPYSRLDTRKLIDHGTAAHGKAAIDTRFVRLGIGARSTQEYLTIRQNLAEPDPLHLAWRDLTKQITREVVLHPERPSLIHH